MKNWMSAAKLNPARRFMLVGAAVLIIALFIYMIFGMVGLRNRVYPGQDIFFEDAVTATGEEGLWRLFPSDSDRVELVPVGLTVGVRFYTDGVMVLGIGEIPTADGSTVSPSKGKLEAGDVVKYVSGTEVLSINSMIDAIKTHHNRDGQVTLEIIRDDVPQKVEIIPHKCCTDGAIRIGCWVRDSTQGIGTITFFDPKTSTFAALGHGILDVDTKTLLPVRSGEILETRIIDIRQGKKGAPGELVGEINESSIIGTITKNTTLGIFGTINQAHLSLPNAPMPIAAFSEISKGPATILSNIEGKGIKTYDVFIESINQDPTACKAMVVRITDPALLIRTNGIVQGMSGSPIIQDDRIIGAITHVFVQNPQRGYGVAIEMMMAQQ
ncbi:MAG: SpoIVB peptidase [Defluviitaleaceae bacterium]|nr:SpoIVB peptidase [Defluviitaleaceae bacterium]